MSVTLKFVTETVRPICTSPLRKATLEQTGWNDKMLKVNTRFCEVVGGKVPDSEGIRLVKAFIACNPSKGLSQIAELHGLKEFTFESKSDAAYVALNFLNQFMNALGGPGGTDMDANENMLAGCGVASCLTMLRADEFIANKDKSKLDSFTAQAAGSLISLLFNVSNRRALFLRVDSDLRANKFLEVLTPFASAK